MILAKLSRRQAKPSAYNTEVRWFSRAFRQPKTRREIFPEAIDKFKAMIWDNPSDDMLPSYGKFFFTEMTTCEVVCRLFFRSRYNQELEPAKICYEVYKILNFNKTKMCILRHSTHFFFTGARKGRMI